MRALCEAYTEDADGSSERNSFRPETEFVGWDTLGHGSGALKVTSRASAEVVLKDANDLCEVDDEGREGTDDVVG